MVRRAVATLLVAALQVGTWGCAEPNPHALVPALARVGLLATVRVPRSCGKPPARIPAKGEEYIEEAFSTAEETAAILFGQEQLEPPEAYRLLEDRSAFVAEVGSLHAFIHDNGFRRWYPRRATIGEGVIVNILRGNLDAKVVRFVFANSPDWGERKFPRISHWRMTRCFHDGWPTEAWHGLVFLPTLPENELYLGCFEASYVADNTPRGAEHIEDVQIALSRSLAEWANATTSSDYLRRALRSGHRHLGYYLAEHLPWRLATRLYEPNLRREMGYGEEFREGLKWGLLRMAALLVRDDFTKYPWGTWHDVDFDVVRKVVGGEDPRFSCQVDEYLERLEDSPRLRDCSPPLAVITDAGRRFLGFEPFFQVPCGQGADVHDDPFFEHVRGKRPPSEGEPR